MTTRIELLVVLEGSMDESPETVQDILTMAQKQLTFRGLTRKMQRITVRCIGMERTNAANASA